MDTQSDRKTEILEALKKGVIIATVAGAVATTGLQVVIGMRPTMPVFH